MTDVMTPPELLSPKARRGKWTAEEEQFVARIVEDFNLGILDVPQGTTLRNFLSSVLNCDPMRITKKYTGNSSIGKRAFMKAADGSIGTEYIQMRRQELQSFKLEWYRSLNNSQRSASKKARSLAYGSTKGQVPGPSSLLDMKLASCSSTAEFSELNMNPTTSYEHLNNGVHNGPNSSCSIAHQHGVLRASSSYDQLVDLDPTCSLGFRHQSGQEKMAELERSISRIPSTLLQNSMLDMESVSNFGFLNPSASLASIPSIGSSSREDLNAIMANSRRNSVQNFQESNSNNGFMISNSTSNANNSSKMFYEYLAGKIGGVGDLNTTSLIGDVNSINRKRPFQNSADSGDEGSKPSGNSLDDVISIESVPYGSSNDNEDISDLEKIVIERSAGLLMKMC